MTSGRREYQDYLDGLSTLRDLPAAQDAQTRVATQAYHRAVSWADTSMTEATTEVEAGEAAVERHLADAAGFLTRAGITHRVPQRIRPSVIPPTATRTDVEAALHDLTDATLTLGRAVDAASSAPPAPQPERPPGAPPRFAGPSGRLSRTALTGLGLLIAGTAGLNFFLLAR